MTQSHPPLPCIARALFILFICTNPGVYQPAGIPGIPGKAEIPIFADQAERTARVVQAGDLPGLVVHRAALGAGTLIELRRLVNVLHKLRLQAPAPATTAAAAARVEPGVEHL